MRKIKMTCMKAAGTGIQPHDSIGAIRGNVDIQALFDDAQDHIKVWTYQSSVTSTIEWNPAMNGRLIYVLKGEVRVGERIILQDGVIVIEHGSRARIRCTVPGTTLIEFEDNHPLDAAQRTGGHVHVLSGEEVLRREKDGVTMALLADSECNSCTLWLHDTHLHKPGSKVAHHFHNEDEVIFVLQGSMLTGSRRLGPGSALFVARHTIYGFAVGDQGLRFINFRPRKPGYSLAGTTEILDESYLVRSAFDLSSVNHHRVENPISSQITELLPARS